MKTLHQSRKGSNERKDIIKVCFKEPRILMVRLTYVLNLDIKHEEQYGGK